MIEKIIQQYCNHMAVQISEIAKIKNRLFQKILYASLLDAMGRARFPDGKNRDRLVGFIDNCSSWKDRNRISLAQLTLLEESKTKLGDRLKDLIKKQTNSWQHGTLPRSEADPLIAEIEAKPEEVKFINQVRYAELFCYYRHALIHEFREPGYGMEVSKDGLSPYYIGVSDKREKHTWELVFPVEFFKALCEDCLKGLQAYLTAQKIDPYTLYPFGSLWIENKRQGKKLTT